jgi:hypothetical protein
VACLQRLLVTFRCQFDTVIGYRLVNLAVFVSFRLAMADQDYHPWLPHGYLLTVQENVSTFDG